MPLNIPVGIPEQKAVVAHTGQPMAMPMWLGERDRNMWLLPIEPLVSVRGRNNIAVRQVAKVPYDAARQKRGYGSVKELWAQGDYEVVITGMFYNTTDPARYPDNDVTRLADLCAKRKPIIVECALLDYLGINQIVILDWEFPQTPNIAWQGWAIRAISDQDWNLLIEK